MHTPCRFSFEIEIEETIMINNNNNKIIQSLVLLFATSFVSSLCLPNIFGAMKRKGLSSILYSSSQGITENSNYFAKYEGLGNDFILVNNVIFDEPIYTPEQAVKICNR